MARAADLEAGAGRAGRDPTGHFEEESFLDRKEWWYLVPDQTVFASGGNTDGQVLNLAARHKDGRWVMAYLASKASFSIQMNKLEGSTRSDCPLDQSEDG